MPSKKRFIICLKCRLTGQEFYYEIKPAKPGIGVQAEEILSVERKFLDELISSERDSESDLTVNVNPEDFEARKRRLLELVRHQAKPIKETVLKEQYKQVAMLTAMGYSCKEIADETKKSEEAVRKTRSRIYDDVRVTSPAMLREWMEKRGLL